jgi:hypothetical protein
LAFVCRYKKNGLTRGEIREKTSVVKPDVVSVDLTFVSSCSQKIDLLDLAKLDQTQKDTLLLELQNSLESVNKKLYLLKA